MRTIAVLTAVALASCAETNTQTNTAANAPAEASSYRAITTAAEFDALVVGKLLTLEGTNTFTVRADGTLDGDFDGPLAGNWRWEDGYWCRTLVTPARPEDCQLWETDGTTLRATRGKGKGTSFVYTM